MRSVWNEQVHLGSRLSSTPAFLRSRRWHEHDQHAVLVVVQRSVASGISLALIVVKVFEQRGEHREILKTPNLHVELLSSLRLLLPIG